MSDGAFQFGGYQHDEFDIEREIARANEAYLAARGIAIPESIRKDVERDEEPHEPR